MAKKTTAQGLKTQLTILGVIGMLAVVGYFLFTGADPTGLFKQLLETPTAGQPPLPESPTPTPVTGSIPTSTPVAGHTPTPTRVAGQTPTPVPLPVGQGGTWWEVYFTDPPIINDPNNLAGSIPEKLIERINNAQKSIHVAAFEFNLTPVAEALIAAKARGVDVKWFTDDESGIGMDKEKGRGQFAMLKKAGIEVENDKRTPLMHNKFWIFDGQVVWTGSTNVTINDNFRNNNNVIVIESPAVAAIYEEEFEELWQRKLEAAALSALRPPIVSIDGTPVQILFAPEDKVMDHLMPLVVGAQKNIRFMAFSFTHVQLGEAVLERAKAGVDVQGIFETRASETEYSRLSSLYCAGLSVRQDGNPGNLHHKVFVIDDKLVVTGSLNFSENADKSNDENTAVISNRDIAALYLQEFDRRWAEAAAPKESAMKCK